MAVLPDYTSGTITLANGSTTVTGSGTLFDVAAFKPGDTLQIQNLTAVIASVDSNTQLTLAEPWTGTDLMDAPYRARYLPDGACVTAQTTTLIELLGNGVLTNLAELGVEEGRVPVGNATGQYELQDYVADPNGNLAELAGLTLAENKLLGTDGSGSLTQSDIHPIVGTVSQSGGIPTGAIIESGSNANGRYIKYASGDMITHTVKASFVILANSSAGSGAVTFPVAFSALPTVSAGFIAEAASGYPNKIYGGGQSLTNTGLGATFYTNTHPEALWIRLHVTATGRWF